MMPYTLLQALQYIDKIQVTICPQIITHMNPWKYKYKHNTPVEAGYPSKAISICFNARKHSPNNKDGGKAGNSEKLCVRSFERGNTQASADLASWRGPALDRVRHLLAWFIVAVTETDRSRRLGSVSGDMCKTLHKKLKKF